MYGGWRARAGACRRWAACDGRYLALRVELHGLHTGYLIAHGRGGVVGAPAGVGDRGAGRGDHSGGGVTERERWAVDGTGASSCGAVDNGAHDLDVRHMDRERFARCPQELTVLMRADAHRL